LVAASALAFGTDHASALVSLRGWTTTSHARFLIAWYWGEPGGGSFVMMSATRSSLARAAPEPSPSHNTQPQRAIAPAIAAVGPLQDMCERSSPTHLEQ